MKDPLAIIYVLHGSQKQQKKQQMALFIDSLQQQAQTLFPTTDLLQLTAYLEHHDQTVAKCLAYCEARGIQSIIVQPLLLFPAMHARDDLPDQVVSHLSTTNYQPHIVYSKTFGNNPELIDILLDRVSEAMKMQQQSNISPIIYGLIHGSYRFSEPIEQWTNLCSKATVPIIPVALYQKPSLHEQLSRQTEPAIVVPVFLSDGHLIEKIQCIIQSLPNADLFTITKTLELDNRLQSSILRELRKAIEKGKGFSYGTFIHRS